MKPEWYADKRDLVKWSVLITLAKKNNIKRIVYAAYLGESNWPPIQIDEKKSELPCEILKHFRDIADIKRIDNKDLNIIIIDTFFTHGEREAYTISLLKVINEISDNIILFLDPDTGLEPPKGKASRKHILKKELKDLWGEIKKGSLLVLYQHKTNRAGNEWIGPKKRQLEKCLGIKESNISIGSSFGIANDVVFFIVKK